MENIRKRLVRSYSSRHLSRIIASDDVLHISNSIDDYDLDSSNSSNNSNQSNDNYNVIQ